MRDLPIGWFLEEYEKRDFMEAGAFALLASSPENSRTFGRDITEGNGPVKEMHPLICRVFLRLFGEKDAEITLNNQFGSEHFRRSVQMKVCDRCYTDCTEHVVVPMSEKATLQSRKMFMKRLDEKREQVFLDGIREDLKKRLRRKDKDEESEEMKLLENLK